MATRYPQGTTSTQSLSEDEDRGGSNKTTYIIIGVVVVIVIVALLIIGGILIWYFFFRGDDDENDDNDGNDDDDDDGCPTCPDCPTCDECPICPDCPDCPPCQVLDVPAIPFIFLDPGSYNVASNRNQASYSSNKDYCRSLNMSQALPVTINNKSDLNINVYFSGVRDGDSAVCTEMAKSVGNFEDERKGYTYLGTYTSVPPKSGKMSFNLFDGIRFMVGTGSVDNPKWVDSVTINDGSPISTKSITDFPGNVPFVQIFKSDISSTPSITISSDGKKANITYITK